MTATPEVYTLSLHDALPIYGPVTELTPVALTFSNVTDPSSADTAAGFRRSEEHTSELQSRLHLVCRLLLEKKNVYSRSSTAYPPYRIPALDVRDVPSPSHDR